MRRQMQLRPSQGGKMRGPVDNRPDIDVTGIDHDELMDWRRSEEDHTCACGYLVCAGVGPCAPVEEPEPVEPEPPLCADGQEVRVGDVYVLHRDDSEEWSFEVSRVSNGLTWFADGDGELGPIAAEDMALRHLVRRAKPSIEVGMRVRVRDDAPHECRGKTGTYRARETCGPEGVWHLVEFDGAFIHPLVRSLDHLEPIG